MRILLYHSDGKTNNYYLLRCIWHAIKSSIDCTEVKIVDHSSLIFYASSGDYDGVLVFGGAGIDHFILRRLSQLSIKKILWTTEDPYEIERNKVIGQFFDYTFTNEINSQHESYEYLPLAASLKYHYQEVKDFNECEYDISFVGTAWPNRTSALEYILNKLPSNINTKICLPFNRYIPKPKFNSPHFYSITGSSNQELISIWNNSKIVLNIGRIFSGNNTHISYSPPPRVYEAALAGTCQVVLSNSSDVQSDYAEKGLVPFSSDIDQVITILESILKDSDLRNSYSLGAQNFTLENHLYEHRVKKILEKFQYLCSLDVASDDSLDVRCKPSVLHIAHNHKSFGAWGGTEVYIEEIISATSSNYNHFVLAPTKDGNVALINYKFGKSFCKVYDIKIGRRDAFEDPCIEKLLSQVVCSHNISIVHIHHLLHWPLVFPLRLKALGCKIVYTMHDYYALCHKWLLMDHHNEYCSLELHPDLSHCALCLNHSGLPANARNVRQEFLSTIFRGVDIFLFSTFESKKLFLHEFPYLAEKCAEIEMLTPPPSDSEVSKINQTISNKSEFLIEQHANDCEPVRIILLGNQSFHKGEIFLMRLLNYLRDGDFMFTIIGANEQCINKIKALNLGNTVRVFGKYDRHLLRETLSQSDVALFLSKWPETYNISLGEAMSSGVIPIASNIGAHKDRILDKITGFLYDLQDEDEVIRILQRLYNDRDLLNKIKKNLESYTPISTADHCRALCEIYKNLQVFGFNDLSVDAFLPIESYELQTNAMSLGVRPLSDGWYDHQCKWDEFS